MKRASYILKAISFLLTILFVSWYLNANLFSHKHIYNGQIVYHSHIHANSHHATPSGGHYAAQLELIDLYTSTTYDVDCFQFMAVFVIDMVSVIMTFPKDECEINDCQSIPSLRAPPVFFV
ncbi:MAG: hypothetical protein HUJ90_03740 [Bacteroidales bacterium]|nr:hypothetical protein [Bacteroidales bacterium]